MAAETRRLRHRRRETEFSVQAEPLSTVRLFALAGLVSLYAFLWFFFRDDILLYGDAVAHINIARRVFDSMHPGILRLGTVWLPLPHLLMIPFVVGYNMWSSGWGASVPSMLAFVLGVAGIYKLMQPRVRMWPAILAAAIFGLNPNLLYLQSTAMTEPLFLATFIWALAYLDRFLAALGEKGAAPPKHSPAKSLEYCAIALAASMLTRYDGWVYSAIFGVVILIRWWTWRKVTGAPHLPQSADVGYESHRVARS